jgi:hypothetical protein
MAGLNGRDVRVAFARATAWGTATSVTKQINLKSIDGFHAKPGIVTDESFNQNFLGTGEMGDYAPSTPELQMDLRYDGTGPLLVAAAMGSAAAPVVVSSVAATSLVAYSHVLTLATDLTKFYTFAVDMGGPGAGTNFVLELPSAKPTGYSIQVGDNGKKQLAVPVVASKAIYNSAINTNSTVGAATADPLANRVFRKQGVFRMNLQSAGSLVAGDAQNVKEVVITAARPVAQDDHVFGQDYIIEPDDDGWADYEVSMTFPRMTSANANSLVIAWPAGTPLKADFTFTGNYINSTTQYGMLFQFPALQITEWDAPLTGHQQIRPVAKAKAYLAASSPLGMAFVQPVRVTITNMNSANLLA